MYIQDENGNKTELLLSPSGDTFPIGAFAFIGTETAPTGWVRADGQEVSRTEYAELFKIFGTTFGNGDGSTTFNLPNVNLENRTLIGSSGDGEFSLGNTIGEKEHALTSAENGPHTHSLDYDYLGYRPGTTSGIDSSQLGVWTLSGKQTTSSGNGTPHNNMQPSIAMTCIIKAKQSVGIVGDVTDNINDTNKKAVPNAKTVKDYVDNQPQVIYCKKNTDMTTNNTYKQIEDWIQLSKVGDGLSVENGKITVDKNINTVKITSKFRLNGATGQQVFTHLVKNGSSISGGWSINNLPGTDLTTTNEVIVNVSEGDTITASIYGDGGTSVKSDATTLIVEKIN